MKKCFKCGEEKDRSEFYAHSGMTDGLLGKCKECTKLYVKNNTKCNKEYYREYDKARAMLPHRVKARAEYQRTDAGKEAVKRASLNWCLANPKKRHCSHMVNNAVRDGKLFKPTTCTQCGASGRIHGHHCDYEKPYDVMWLCPACHMKWHKINGEGLNG